KWPLRPGPRVPPGSGPAAARLRQPPEGAAGPPPARWWRGPGGGGGAGRVRRPGPPDAALQAGRRRAAARLPAGTLERARTFKTRVAGAGSPALASAINTAIGHA